MSWVFVKDMKAGVERDGYHAGQNRGAIQGRRMGGYLSWIGPVRGTGQESQKGNPVQQSEFWAFGCVGLALPATLAVSPSVRQSGVGEGEKRPMEGTSVRRRSVWDGWDVTAL